MKVGVLGGGQLGRMIALAGYPLGVQCRFFDTSSEAPAGQVAPLVVGDYDDVSALRRFVSGLDVATFEFENVPVDTATALAALVPVLPGTAVLAAARDRLEEKNCFRGLGIPTAPFAPVDSERELQEAVEKLGLPAILKTRRMGYDGKGQLLLRQADDLPRAWRKIGDVPLLLEGVVPFERELSVLAVRGRSGETATYPLVENHHAGGILRLSIAPAPRITPALERLAHDYVQRVLHSFGYVGVLAIELFQVGEQLLANEMAPRVHNSGHWTIEGAACSQFENHLRAITGMPLGSTEAVSHSAMLNLIGTIPPSAPLLRVPDAHLHVYGKSAAPGRKLGHVTVRAADAHTLRERLESVQREVGADGA